MGTGPASVSGAPGTPQGSLSSWLSFRLEVRPGWDVENLAHAVMGGTEPLPWGTLVSEGRAGGLAGPQLGSPFLEARPGGKQHFQ